MSNKKEVPQIGLGYHFFDDGKICPSRYYIAEILDVIPFNEASDIIIETTLRYHSKCIPLSDGSEKYSVKLLDIWEKEKYDYDWIFSEDTDYFVKARILDYDDEVWFVRTKTGGWFSMDTTDCWQGGVLDVDGELFSDNNVELNYTRKLPHDRK